MKRNKKTTNLKTVGRNIALGLGAFTILFALAVLASCDNEPKPPVCTCNPKYHGSEDGATNLCCGIGTCETFTGKVMANGTKIILESGVSVTGAFAENKINAVFQFMVENDVGAQADFAKNNIKIIRIVPGTATITTIVNENGVWVAKINVATINSNDLFMIGGEFWNFAEENMVATLFKQMDNSKNTVRMAFGKVVEKRMI